MTRRYLLTGLASICLLSLFPRKSKVEGQGVRGPVDCHLSCLFPRPLSESEFLSAKEGWENAVELRKLNDHFGLTGQLQEIGYNIDSEKSEWLLRFSSMDSFLAWEKQLDKVYDRNLFHKLGFRYRSELKLVT